ncbi:MAG: hypothetical protein KBI47_16495, partial [Armatimonadetes bacterium]|nr:hypothetical protein [Armatimonadota bacterium]
IEAEDALPEADTISVDAVKQWRDFQLGCVLSAQGIYEDAYEAFVAATQGPSVVYSDVAWLRRGECLEFQGKWDEAVSAYAHLEAFASVPQFRAKARFWAHRVSNLAADYKPSIGVGAVYWGEDRQTQGQWDSYGEETFLLCGRMAPGDLMGGLAAPVRYRVYTADKSKHNWWWNYDPVTEHPSVMIDPPRAHATACNWDDGGEKQEVGTGPDLMVDFPIPEGLHRLSLYLVNDFNYYEPNREYTIYLLNADRHVLAACPVRDFEQGVYHHFAIQGPQTITFRVFRNLSMNTLLQGIFLDRIDAEVDARISSDTFGPLGEILQDHDGAEPDRAESPIDAVERRQAIRLLLGSDRDRVQRCHRVANLLTAFGAGRLCTLDALERIYGMVLDRIGPEASIDFWSRTADAQLKTGYRAGAVRYTLWAQRAANGTSISGKECLGFLDRCLARMHANYPYYVTESRHTPTSPMDRPASEPYARGLADAYIEVAFQGRDLMQASSDILPMARKYLRLGGRTIPKRFFEAIGIENMGGSDLYDYSVCCDDDEACVRALRGALVAPGGAGPWGDDWVRCRLLSALGRAGYYDEAEAELEGMLASETTARFTKANGAYNVAVDMMLRGDKVHARKWFEYVIEHFPDLWFAKNARGFLDAGLKLPWEGMR